MRLVQSLSSREDANGQSRKLGAHRPSVDVPASAAARRILRVAKFYRTKRTVSDHGSNSNPLETACLEITYLP